MRIQQHSLIVLGVVCKVFYFLLAISERSPVTTLLCVKGLSINSAPIFHIKLINVMRILYMHKFKNATGKYAISNVSTGGLVIYFCNTGLECGILFVLLSAFIIGTEYLRATDNGRQ